MLEYLTSIHTMILPQVHQTENMLRLLFPLQTTISRNQLLHMSSISYQTLGLYERCVQKTMIYSTQTVDTCLQTIPSNN